MDRIRVWYDRLSCGDDGLCDLIAQELSASGIDLYPLQEQAPTGPGLVFFDVVSQQLIEMLRRCMASSGNRILAIVLTGGFRSSSEVWQLMGAGASDVFPYTRSPELALSIAARLRRWHHIDRLMQSPLVQDNLVGRSYAWAAVLRQVIEAACYTASPMLITGESGTGKELVARLIHTLDMRKEKRNLVTLDCTTVIPELAGSEFFGHERGAFTNAHNAREGAFALADGGTLFLDEVGELPLQLQAELLRVVQERTYKRVGGNEWMRTDFRLVCATNRDLAVEEKQGRFRRDFYYRIAAVTCALPPLRERGEDILPLARRFWKQLRPDEPMPEFDPAVRDFLLTREYPGNARDLRQLIARMCCRHVGTGPVTVGNIPEDDRPTFIAPPGEWRDAAFDRAIRKALSLGRGLKDIGREAEEAAERVALADEEGNLQRAADKLGVTDRALQMRRAARRLQSV